jgi:hypothetical protein
MKFVGGFLNGFCLPMGGMLVGQGSWTAGLVFLAVGACALFLVIAEI